MRLFTENEVEHIYNQKVKKSNEYFEKYRILPKCPVKLWNYNWGNHDYPRNWCILDFQEWVVKYGIYHVDRLGVTCDSDPELQFVSANYTNTFEYPQYDLHQKFPPVIPHVDFFIFNQTIEHLYNPQVALSNIYNILNENGLVFTSVPTINIPHMIPFHFNGYTPLGLTMLLETNGFEVLETGQWGNLEYIKYIFQNHTSTGYEAMGNLPNEEQNVCECWALARKK
jgi:SAM-dependent methyltransferase